MPRLVTLLLAFMLLFAPGSARGQSNELNELNKKAIAELNAKKFDEGIALFQRVLELAPKNTASAYNLSCAYSLKNEIDKSVEWMNTAIDWGWGSGQGTLATNETKSLSQVDMMRSDADLENLRKDPRFETLLKRIETRGKKIDEYVGKAAVYIPEKIAEAPEMPLLVVLHDNGSTKEQVITGRWKAIADQLGTALVAPSGKISAGDDPAKGMAWWDDLAAFQQKSWSFEKTISEAVTAFKKDHKLEKSRVFIAGEGAGSVVAFDVAIGSPGLYKGALGLNGRLLPQLLSTKAPTAGKMGLKLELLMETADSKKSLGPDQDLEKVIASWNQSLQTWGIGGGVKSFTLDPKDPKEVDKLLLEALKRLEPAAGAVEAGAAK